MLHFTSTSWSFPYLRLLHFPHLLFSPHPCTEAYTWLRFPSLLPVPPFHLSWLSKLSATLSEKFPPPSVCLYPSHNPSNQPSSLFTTTSLFLLSTSLFVLFASTLHLSHFSLYPPLLLPSSLPSPSPPKAPPCSASLPYWVHCEPANWRRYKAFQHGQSGLLSAVKTMLMNVKNIYLVLITVYINDGLCGRASEFYRAFHMCHYVYISLCTRNSSQ